jgi:hypothetical protein
MGVVREERDMGEEGSGKGNWGWEKKTVMRGEKDPDGRRTAVRIC